MDEDGDDSSLSRRDKTLLRRALYETDESVDLNAGDLGFDSECDWTPAPDEDPNMLTESPETSPREIKRPRLDIGRAQSLQQPKPSPSHSRDILITADEEMYFIEEDIIPVLDVSQVPHAQPLHQNAPTRQLRERGDLQPVSEPIILETDVFSVAPVPPSLDCGSPLPLGSPATLFTQPIVDSSCDEIVCDFDPDYFQSCCNDDEDDSGAAVYSDAYELNDYMEALQFIDEEPSPEEDTSKESRCATEIPLYNNASINQWESITSILSFVQSEHLSAAGLGRLLSLIYLHLPKPNNFLKTTARFLQVLDQYDEPVHIHYFCSICYK